ncbi:MAG: hypothetical protein OHK0052_01610 [Anaerolineales bacterium]
MFTPINWLRLAASGREVYNTIAFLSQNADLFLRGQVGAPYNGIDYPCERCHFHARTSQIDMYCPVCALVVNKRPPINQYHFVLWGAVNQITEQTLQIKNGVAYALDEQHFILTAHARSLRPWLEQIALYYGYEWLGYLQISPTVGKGYRPTMSEILTTIIASDKTYPLDKLRLRFYSRAWHSLKDDSALAGYQTFDLPGFLQQLEMASLYRAAFMPDEQQAIAQISTVQNAQEAQFLWSRLLGRLSAQQADLINLWRMRSWSQARHELLQSMLDYVVYTT